MDLRNNAGLISTRLEHVEIIALRLVLPPLVVIVASLAQRRLGDRLGGLLVGLPLTSGTFLVLLLPRHGRALVAEAAVGMLAGQVAVIAFAWVYARLVWTGVLAALVGSLLCWTMAVSLIRLVDPMLAIALVFTLLAGVALTTWRTTASTPATQACSPKRRELASRVLIASVLILALTAGVEVLGSHLAGLLAAAPLVALVIAPATHRQRGSAAAQSMLQGVVRGSVGAATFAIVMALCVESLGGCAFFAAGAAGVAAIAVVSSCSRMSRAASPVRSAS